MFAPSVICIFVSATLLTACGTEAKPHYSSQESENAARYAAYYSSPEQVRVRARERQRELSETHHMPIIWYPK